MERDEKYLRPQGRLAVVGPRNQAFWQCIVNLFEDVSDLEIRWFESPEELASLDPVTAPEIAALPWSKVHDRRPWFDRHDLPPCRVLIGLDDAANESLIWIRAMSRDELIALTRTVATLFRANVENSDSTGKSKVFLKYVYFWLRWVELVLREHIASQLDEDEASFSHVPGLTLGSHQIRNLLNATQGETPQTVSRFRTELEVEIAQHEAAFGESQLTRLRKRFNLSAIEVAAIAFALAPELETRFQRVYGYLHDDVTQIYATTGLIARMLQAVDSDSVSLCQRLLKTGAIPRYGLLEAEPNGVGRYGPESPTRLPQDVLSFLLGSDWDTSALPNRLQLLWPEAAPAEGPEDRTAQELVHLAARRSDGAAPLLIQVVAPREAADWASGAIRAGGQPVLIIDLHSAGEVSAADADALARTTARVAKLTGAIPLVDAGRMAETSGWQPIKHLLALVPVVLVALREAWVPPDPVEVRVLEPFAHGRTASADEWLALAQAHGLALAAQDADELAATRRDLPPRAATICKLVRAEMVAGRDDTRSVIRALRNTTRRFRLDRSAQFVRRIEPVFDWNDIVLRPAQLAELRQIPDHLRHSRRVLQDWDYASKLPYGRGIGALFAGPSGTGKTMAAQIVAKDLGVEVFQVDLAKTVSKFIGETEEHLDLVFDDAEQASAVLLFDEADALFGKRTEIKDAHDRYANVEVAYLLQRLEQFQGLVILTTNFKQNLDAAFLRRLRFSIDFPSPSVDERLQIWERAFPKQAPLGPDVDFAFLARRFQLTGGHIQQIALMAAFLAALGDAIEMRHIVRATRQQLSKLGMVTAEQSLAEHAALVWERPT